MLPKSPSSVNSPAGQHNSLDLYAVAVIQERGKRCIIEGLLFPIGL